MLLLNAEFVSARGLDDITDGPRLLSNKVLYPVQYVRTGTRITVQYYSDDRIRIESPGITHLSDKLDVVPIAVLLN
jgi:hypothetical protein